MESVPIEKLNVTRDTSGNEGSKRVLASITTAPEDPVELTPEEKLDLITSARSIDSLLRWAHYFVRSDFGILCTTCGTVLQYDFNNGHYFTDSAMPDSFRHLKYDLKRHILSDTHKESVKVFQKQKLNDELSFKEGKENALNCASAAYLTYKLNTSYKSYESVITELHNSGSSVGCSNHSKEFCRLFLPHVHSVLKKEIASYIIDNDLPVGIFADKITLNHRSRHIVGMRVPIFDISSERLFNCIYLEHNFVPDFTGKGLTGSILNTCKKFCFDTSFLRNNLVGMAFDGQYIILGVEQHMKDELVLENLSVSWDFMHRIELAEKHSSVPDLVKKCHTLINDAMKEFSSGKKYELLLQSSKEFEDYFYKPKAFKTMKFASYSESVFKTFLGDYRSLVSAVEKSPESFALRDSLLSKTNIFVILLLADTFSILSSLSKEVQSSYHLPWQYVQFMENIQVQLEIMIRYVNDISSANSRDSLLKTVNELPEAFFKHTKLSCEFIMDSSTFKGVPLPDVPVSSKVLRSLCITVGNEVVIEIEKCAKEFLKFLESLKEQCLAYLSTDEDEQNNHTVKVIKIADFLFNLDFLIFPKNNVSCEKADKSFGSFEDFYDTISVCSYSFLSTVDKRKLFFEYKQVLLWMTEKLSFARVSDNILDFKYLFKLTVTDLQQKYPIGIKLLKFLISTPVSEAICESWGSVITNVMNKRPAASDFSYEEIGTTDMLAYIMINGPPAGYKGNRKFLKLALCQKYGTQYYNHFKPVSKNKLMSQAVTSKVIRRIQEDLNESLPCFKIQSIRKCKVKL